MKQEGYDLLYLDPNTHHGQFNRVPNYSKSFEYGKFSHGLPHLQLLLDFNPESWLDVGCGYNTLIKEVREKYVKDSWGIDFACPVADQVCDVLDLPFFDKRWDLVTAFDVMEHIYPDDVDKALQEMRRVSKRFAYTICFKKAQLEHKGLNAHATIMSRADWYKKIDENGGDIIAIENSKFRSSHRSNEFISGEWR
jgi:ubiquinone/menaquinone biosynthesis C-methylase UbiE